MTEKDYCSPQLVEDLKLLGMEAEDSISLYDAQMWLMTKGIHISPRIYLYHDILLDEETSWECTIYVEYRSIRNIGRSLTYQAALELGIKDSVELLKQETL